MHPYDHARSSARQFFPQWVKECGEHTPALALLPLHHYFDSSKAAFGSWQHRALRHHREAFPAAVKYALESNVPTLAHCNPEVLLALCEQHLLEDLGRVATLSEWRTRLEDPPWSVVEHDSLERAAKSVQRYGGTLGDTLALHEWLDERCLGDSGYGFWRHHAFGLFEAEAHFGPVREIAGRPIPTRVILEGHLRDDFGRVPSAQDWLAKIRIASWMRAPSNDS